MQIKESNIEEKNNEQKISPIVLPPLYQISNNNKTNKNNLQNLPFLLSNVKQFKFKITKKKKIKYINFNQNKIIENVNKSNDEKQKPLIRVFSNNIKSNDIKRNIKGEINDIKKKIENEEQKAENLKKFMNNEALKNMRIQLGKSQSSGLFPKIKIA